MASKPQVIMPVEMAGEAQPSKKARRRKEDDAALGGMRNPAESVQRLPLAPRAFAPIRQTIEALIDREASLLKPVSEVLGGTVTDGFSKATVEAARAAVRKTLGLGEQTDLSGGALQPDIIEELSSRAGDPDGVLAQWLRGGAPLGAEVPVPHTGVFPIDHADTREDPESLPATAGDELWENYKSAEEELSTSLDILNKMVKKGWSVRYSSLDQAAKDLGVAGLTLNKLGLIIKVKPDGSTKYRLVWDLRRSGVNAVTLQGERVVLPRILDLVNSIAAIACQLDEEDELVLLGTDIADAFHQVPLDPREWKFTAAALGGYIFVFKVLVFGSVSAPTVWGRYAAWLGRSTCALLFGERLRMHIYVDDPIYVVGGSGPVVRRLLTTALLWAAIVGFPIAWHKCDGGRDITWIGAAVRIASGRTRVSIPEAKIVELFESCSAMLKQNTVPSRDVRKLAGKGSFVAGLVPTLAPFLRSLWATGAKQASGGADDARVLARPTAGQRGRPLPRHLVFVSQIRRDLSWLTAFLSRQRGTLVRDHLWQELPETDRLRICVDASPWGIGGVLMHRTTPIAYFADGLGAQDLRRFQASLGDSAFNTVWEALAILVGLRLWRCRLATSGSFEIRSDSLGALGATLKCASSSPGLNAVVAEIMLDEAEFSTRIAVLKHIPGVSNVWPDALSRLEAPSPKHLPHELACVERTFCCPRDSDFWITMKAWKMQKPRSTPPLFVGSSVAVHPLVGSSVAVWGGGGNVVVHPPGGTVLAAAPSGRSALLCRRRHAGRVPSPRCFSMFPRPTDGGLWPLCPLGQPRSLPPPTCPLVIVHGRATLGR